LVYENGYFSKNTAITEPRSDQSRVTKVTKPC